MLPNGIIILSKCLGLNGFKVGVAEYACCDVERIPVESIGILNFAEIAVGKHGDLFVEFYVHAARLPLGVMDYESDFIGSLTEDFATAVIGGRIADGAVYKWHGCTASKTHSHLITILSAVIVMVISRIRAGRYCVFVPFVGNQFTGQFHPDVDSRRGRIPFQGLAVYTSGNKVVLENKVVGTLRHFAGHYFRVLVFLRAGCGNDDRTN